MKAGRSMTLQLTALHTCEHNFELRNLKFNQGTSYKAQTSIKQICYPAISTWFYRTDFPHCSENLKYIIRIYITFFSLSGQNYTGVNLTYQYHTDRITKDRNYAWILLRS